MKIRVLKLFFAIIFSLLSLIPLFFLISNTLKNPLEIVASPIVYIPSKLVFENYIAAFKEMHIYKYIFNSFIISLSTAIIVIIITSTAAYACRRFNFKNKYLLIILVLFFQIVPGIVILVPLYFYFLNMGLINKYIGLILGYCASSVPFCFLLLRSYVYSAYPKSIDESAAVDGCSDIQIFFRIMVPLCAPGIAAIGLFSFIGAWNEFMFASVLIRDASLQTVQQYLARQLGQFGNVAMMGAIFAATLISVIPIFLIGFYLQRFMVMGLSGGSVKE